jgi:ElaB/YqjD/DUF883 family membrane-anchored ribosome-binding protein
VNGIRRADSVCLALLAALTGGGCGLFSKPGDSVERVDDLLTRVERVHVDSRIAKEKALAALERLRTMVSPEFAGDPVACYAQFVEAVEESNAQADRCRSNLGPLRDSADEVFAKWAADLETFGNLQMRQRSQARLEETRTRFQAVLAAAESAQLAYDAFNGDLRDHSLFLGHDFNAMAVAAIAPDVQALATRSEDLGKRLDACVDAAQTYVETAALPGQLRVTHTENAPAGADEELGR